MNELTLFAGVTILYTAIAMWSTQPSYSCVMSEQPRQRLYLDREVHREHLGRDTRRIRLVAARYAGHEGKEITEPGTGSRCLELLTRQLSTDHDVPIDAVRAAMSDER